MSAPRPSPRPLRRDAAANAERLLAAAVRAGLTRGSAVPMAEIAAEAGVGVGTLYRRFANRDALLLALQVRAFELLVGIGERALADADSGRGAVRLFLERSFEVRDQLVLPLHGAPAFEDAAATAGRERVRGLVEAMLVRGRADGTLRADVTSWTVIAFGALLAQSLPDAPATTAWIRTAVEQRAVFLRGISPPAAPCPTVGP